MKKVPLILIFLLTIVVCFGQKEHLEPEQKFSPDDSTGYRGKYPTRKEYNDHLSKLLYSGFSQKPDVRYTCKPAFTAEYAFSVEKIDDKIYVISNKLSENCWYALVEGRGNSLSINSKKTEISTELYLKIGELFELLTEQTKEKEGRFETLPDGTVVEYIEFGSDGETYIFTITDKNGEIRSGKTWSPRKESLLGRLVKICDELCSIRIDNSIFQAPILKEIELLLNDLQHHNTT